MFPISRMLDKVICFLRCPTGVIQIPINYTVYVEALPVGVVGSICSNCTGRKKRVRRHKCRWPNYAITGSLHTYISGLPTLRVTSLVTKGLVVSGSLTCYVD